SLFPSSTLIIRPRWQTVVQETLFVVRMIEIWIRDKTMPLAFHSKSHGVIVFGFFNIEPDMLLLENLFFFADRFCNAVVVLAEQSEETTAGVLMDGYRIKDPAMMGNLHGAIQ